MVSFLFIPQYTKAEIVQMLEGEIKGGLTLPVGSYHGGKPVISMLLGLEGRYNFEDMPWDLGLMVEWTTANRNFASQFGGTSRNQNNRTLILAAVGDYNFRQGKFFNPFLGIAVGVGYNDTVGERFFPSEGTSFVFNPRFGIEIWQLLRFTGEFNLCRKGYNNFSISLGLVLGGRAKRKR